MFGGVVTPLQNRSAFGPNASRRFASFTDGLSQSLLATEVKTYQQAYHNCGGVPPPATAIPTVVPDPATIMAAIAAAPAQCKSASGHTHWFNGNSFYDGFTTALPPKYVVSRRNAPGRLRRQLQRRGRWRPDLRRGHVAELPSRRRQRPVCGRERSFHQELDQLSNLAHPWERSPAARSSHRIRIERRDGTPRLLRPPMTRSPNFFVLGY